MDAVSYSLASKQAQRIEKFIENPDSNSGVLTQPKVIEAGETVTIKSGRQAILADTVVDGELVIESGGDVFVPAGATFGDLEDQIALKADSASPTLTDARIELAATTWTNPYGIEYFDEGLLGVPDTTFSSTGARLYPDGIIRGKSSYGKYVKYPDGRLSHEVSFPSQTFSSNSYGSLIIHTYPHKFVGDLPYQVTTLGTNFTNSTEGGVLAVDYGIGNNLTGNRYRPNGLGDGASTSTYYPTLIAIGRWN